MAGAALVVPVFFLGSDELRGLFYYLGFVSLGLALVVAVMGWVWGRGRSFTFLPRTRWGWSALGTFGLGLALTIVPSYVQTTTLAAGNAVNSVVRLGFFVMFLASVVGLWSVRSRAERSVGLVALALAVAVVVPYFLLAAVIEAH
ncbi:MAG: hypothetical protein ACXVEC_01120 [Nocardioides sp.]